MKCKPTYPVSYDYARGMLLIHKPWSKEKTTDQLVEEQKEDHLHFSTYDKLPTSPVCRHCSVYLRNEIQAPKET